jgi:hypothetical protein
MPAPAFLQGNSAAAASALTAGSTFVFTYDSNTGNNSVLIIAVRESNSPSLTGVSDNINGAWSTPVQKLNSGIGFDYSYKLNPIGGSKPTVTLQFVSAGITVSPVWAEYGQVGSFRGGDGGATGSSANATTGTFASIVGDLLVAMECGLGGTVTASLTGAGNTPTAREKSSLAGNSYCAIADGISAGGTLAGSFASINTAWSAGLLVFAPVGAGGGSKSWLTVAAANALRGLRH